MRYFDEAWNLSEPHFCHTGREPRSFRNVGKHSGAALAAGGFSKKFSRRNL